MLKIVELLPITLTVLFFAALAIQLFYYLYFYLRLPLSKDNQTENHPEPVSVIICARNEAEHLKDFIPKIMEQDYHQFEVIVVNDCSNDSTEMVLAQMKLRYPKLRYTNIVEDLKFKHNKKLAVTVGVKAAKNEHLIFTDADCYPESDKWLYSMQQGFGWDKELVLGYGGYEERKGFINKVIRYDSLSIAMNYIGFAKASVPYMGVGRNLAYTRTLFFRNKGFASNYELNSGDDDLLVNETANSKNTSTIITRSSIVRSIPKSSFKEYFFQKRRHVTTSSRYKNIHRLLLGVELLSRFVLYATIIPAALLIPDPRAKWYIIGGMGIRTIAQLIIVKMTMIKLNERKILLYSLLLDILLPVIYFTVHVSNIVARRRSKYRWK